MKKLVLIVFASLALLPGLLQADPSADVRGKSGVDFFVKLEDGSKVNGMVSLATFELKSEVAGSVKISVKSIKRIVFCGKSKGQRVFLANGDILSGTLVLTRIKLKTPMGSMTVPLEDFISMKQSAFNGLEARYSFQGDARDSSGNEIHGTVHGATPCEDRHGHKNSAYAFDGVDDYIKFNKPLPDMKEMTVSAWVYAENKAVWFGDADWLSGNDVTIQCMPKSIFLRADKGKCKLCDKIDVGIDLQHKWRHITWTMTPKHSDLYIDGVHCARIKKSGSNVGYHDFILGTMEHPKGRMGWMGYWKGKLANLQIYSRALSSEEIQNFYKRYKEDDKKTPSG